MQYDARGLAVTGATLEVAAGLDRFVTRLLGMGRDVPEIFDLADANPSCPLAQAYAASLYVFAQSPRQFSEGRRWLTRARAQADAANDRERSLIEAVAAGLAGDCEAAIAEHEKIAERCPQETVSAKLAEFHLFETGETERQRRLMAAFAEANPDDPEVLAMYGFAQELNACPDEAERLARRALELEPDTPWAEHCLAHVHARRGEIECGIGALTKWAPHWERKNQYIRSHNSFHLATLHLAQRDFAPVREIYRRAIWGFQPDAVVEHTDAIVLLWYLELAGAGDASAWREIAARIVENSPEQVFPFLNILYLFALTRAGAESEAELSFAAFERYADSRTGRAREVWHAVGLGLARAVLAYARGEWVTAAAFFAPLVAYSGEGGGSDEQRGVFAESWLLSLIKSGEYERARERLDARIGAREPTLLERHWLALVRA